VYSGELAIPAGAGHEWHRIGVLIEVRKSRACSTEFYTRRTCVRALGTDREL
jgi:hypothetical protein